MSDRLGDDKIKSMLNRKEPSYSLFGNRKSLVASERVCSESTECFFTASVLTFYCRGPLNYYTTIYLDNYYILQVHGQQLPV